MKIRKLSLDIIEYYFKRGFQYESILLFLSHNHDLNMSLSTLKRRLNDYGLSKAGDLIDDDQLRQIISNEIEEPGSQLGYRGM